jgi:hypothetical protein
VATSENQYIAVAVTAAVVLSQQLKHIEATVARTESRVADIANREVALSQQLNGIKRHTDYLVAGIVPIICIAARFVVALLVEHELAARFGEGLVSWGGSLATAVGVWWCIRKRVTSPP